MTRQGRVSQSSNSPPKNKTAFRFYYDEKMTQEAQTAIIEGAVVPRLRFDDPPVGVDAVQRRLYVRFNPPMPDMIGQPGDIRVVGDGQFVESNMPTKLRSGDSFRITIEHTPRRPSMSLETLTQLECHVEIPLVVIAPTRE